MRLSKRLKGKRGGDLEHEEAVREAEIRAIEEKLEEAEA